MLLSLVAVSMWRDHQQTALATAADGSVQVMIDPGHGGYDPGVKSALYKEANITLALAKLLQADLQKRGISSALTRETDTDYADNGQRGKQAKRADLGKRIDMTNEKNAQLFISLHCNNSSAATRGGAEVFYNDVPGAKDLGENVQKALWAMPNMSKRDAKTADYYLLRNQKIPALIVECGYLNISADRVRLTTPTSQAKLAAAIADGIERYLKENPPADQSTTQSDTGDAA